MRSALRWRMAMAMLFFGVVACGGRGASSLQSSTGEATTSSLTNAATSSSATSTAATSSTSPPSVSTTIVLGEGDVVAQLVGQTYVLNVEDLNSGTLHQFGSVTMPVGSRLISESSVGLDAVLIQIAIPDRGIVVLLTRPVAGPSAESTGAYIGIDGVEILLEDSERIETADCTIDGHFANGRAVAVIAGAPEYGPRISVRLAWLVNDDATSIDQVAPSRLECTLSNPD